MIKNFNNWLVESGEQSLKISDIFNTVSRFYDTAQSFNTDNKQFTILEERRDWGDIRQKAELEKLKVQENAFYKLVFINDEVKYLLEINFNFSYIGKKEKDAPETASEEQLCRLNTTLEKIEIKKILLKSGTVDYVSNSSSKSVRRACEKFIIKMMVSDYDSLGAELYNLEH